MPALLLSLLCAAGLVSLGDLRAAAPTAVAVLLIWGLALLRLPMPTWSWRGLILSAVAVRLVLLFMDPTLSDDIFRYLWEGRAVSMGGNPYLHPPADAIWAGLGQDSIRAAVNHPEVGAIYPPLTLWLFGVVSSLLYHPLGMKLAMAFVDVGVVWGLGRVLQGRRRSLAGAWLYALHPLGAVESAGSGHLESLALLMVLLAIRDWDRGRSGLGWAAIGGLLKFLPFLLVPVLWRRSPWLLGLAALLGVGVAWPFLDAGPAMLAGLGTYTTNWAFNGSVHPMVHAAIGEASRPLLVAVGGIVLLWAMRRFADPARVALWAGGAFVLLSPTVHPWYILWAWVPALICGVRAWSLLAALVPVSYIVLASYDASTSAWSEELWPRFVQYLPFLAALLWESWRHMTQAGPWAPGAAMRRSRSPSRTSPAA
jgi:hypothetical protein